MTDIRERVTTVELAQIPPVDPMADMSHEEFMSMLTNKDRELRGSLKNLGHLNLEPLPDGDAAEVQEAR